MKKLLFILTVFAGLGLQAQKIPNATVTDCNGNSKDIYSVLASGKVLVIASKGLDCGICKSHASNYESFISNNGGQIEGWGAMTWLYQQTTPTCSDINSWNSTYSWNNIFSFVDANRDFFMSGTPRYIVINPADSMIVYSGGNFNAMQNAALMYVTSNISVSENELNDFSVYQIDNTIMLKDFEVDVTNFEATLYNVLGQPQMQWTEILNNKLELNRSLNNGVYLLHLKMDGVESTKRLVWRP